MKVREQILYALSLQGYTATLQNMKRAYWRMAKQRGGICGTPSIIGYTLAEYLKNNGMVQKLEQREKKSGLILAGI